MRPGSAPDPRPLGADTLLILPGEVVVEMMERAQAGEDIEMIYIEMYAHTEFCSSEDDVLGEDD